METPLKPTPKPKPKPKPNKMALPAKPSGDTKSIIMDQLKKRETPPPKANSYWATDDLNNILEGVKPEEEQAPQVEVVQTDLDLDPIITACEKELIGQVEELTHLTASYLQQRILADLDQDIAKLIKEFENAVSAKLANSMLDIQASPMPNGTRFALPFGNLVVYIVEEPPSVRTIHYMSNRYTLAFPYMIFGLTVDRNGLPGHLHVACSNKQLDKLTDRLSKIHLSNIYNNFNEMGVCDSFISSPTRRAGKDGATIAQKVDAIITQFWSSEWNGAGMTSKCRDKRVKTMDDWAKMTKNDPMEVLKVDWQDGRTDVKGLAIGLAGRGAQRLGDGKGIARLDENFKVEGKKLIDSVKKLIQEKLTVERISLR